MIRKKIYFILMLVFLFSAVVLVTSEQSSALSYDGLDLAQAIVNDPSIIVSSNYEDTDQFGTRQSGVFTSFGDRGPTNGTNFIIMSTGIAGAYPVTTNQEDPGCERGSWFMGGQDNNPADRSELQIVLQVPPLAQYLKYDVRFYSAEAPEWIGSGFNDNLEIRVDAPSQTEDSLFVLDVDSNLFRDEAPDIVDSGFDIFAVNGHPHDGRNDVTTELGPPWHSDAGATILWRVENEHPVLGPEIATITISIEDDGDNMYDSAAFIDNIRFEEYAEVNLEARKYVRNLEEHEIDQADAGETVKYIIQLLNGGDIPLSGNDFEDYLDDYLELVPGSLTADSGDVEYISESHKITWEGTIPSKNYVEIEYQATISQYTPNATIIANNGSVHWDSNNNGILDSWSHTNYANLTIINFNAPDVLTENFADDSPGGIATQSYMTREWFETGLESSVESTFSVVSGYSYTTDNSFKTKIRQSSGTMYWYYDLENVVSDLDWWEIIFACGNTSEPTNLILDFKNTDNQDIARLKFEYVHEGTGNSTDWVLNAYYYDKIDHWTLLTTDSYLFNGWYKIRIERNDTSMINYILEKANGVEITNITDNKLDAAFENFDHIEFYSTEEPIVCQMFFWDEHRIGLRAPS